MSKRPNTSLVLAQEPKRSRNDLMAYTNRDKALMEAVSRRLIFKLFDFNKLTFIGCKKNLKFIGTHYASGRSSR